MPAKSLNPLCSLPGCGRPFLAKGFCHRHYLKWYRCGDPNADNRHKKGVRRKHGESKKTTEYRIWANMRDRCNNKSNHAYERYGGRGITICERWREYDSFLADMGRRPGADFTLDRIDNDGPYSPENCRWATRKEQARNRRSNTWVVIGGNKMRLCEASELLGIASSTLSQRIKTGTPLDNPLGARS